MVAWRLCRWPRFGSIGWGRPRAILWCGSWPIIPRRRRRRCVRRGLVWFGPIILRATGFRSVVRAGRRRVRSIRRLSGRWPVVTWRSRNGRICSRSVCFRWPVIGCSFRTIIGRRCVSRTRDCRSYCSWPLIRWRRPIWRLIVRLRWSRRLRWRRLLYRGSRHCRSGM